MGSPIAAVVSLFDDSAPNDALGTRSNRFRDVLLASALKILLYLFAPQFYFQSNDHSQGFSVDQRCYWAYGETMQEWCM